MIIAYYDVGSLSYENTRRDGACGIRRGLIGALLNRGHEVCWVGRNLDKKFKKDPLMKHVTYCEYQHVMDADLFIGTARYPFFAPSKGDDFYWFLKHLEFYSLANIPLLIWDTDLVFPGVLKGISRESRSWAKRLEDIEFPMSIGNYTVLKPYLADFPEFEKQVTFLNAIDWELADPMPKPEPKYLMCYLGSDYNRRPKMEKFVLDVWRRMGIYSNDKVVIKGVWGRKKGAKDFMKKWEPYFDDTKQVSPGEVRSLYRDSMFTAQIVQPKYEKYGFMSYRPWEATSCGCICLCDTEIKNADKIIIPELLVRDSIDVDATIYAIINDGYEARFELIKKQVKKFSGLGEWSDRAKQIEKIYRRMR